MTECIKSLLLKVSLLFGFGEENLVIAPSKGETVFFFLLFYVITPDMQYFKGGLPPSFRTPLRIGISLYNLYNCLLAITDSCNEIILALLYANII